MKNKVQIKWKHWMLIFLAIAGCSLHAQDLNRVTGMVTDESNDPLIGVNVQVQGSNKGTATNFDGGFILDDVNVKDKVLVFSYIGYETKNVALEGQNSIIVMMSESSSLLDEVVVVGYGTQKKVNLTGAVDQVGDEMLKNRPVSNLSRSLQGAIPNLNIKQVNGRPTSSPEYNIRGLTSIGAGGSALILIDGVPGDPALLNPADIKSVSVLKDASSAAIYGARGAFGVILITTNDYNDSKAKISYSGSYSQYKRTVEKDYITDPYVWTKQFAYSYSGWYDYNRQPSAIGASGINFSPAYLEELKYRSENPDHGRPKVDVDPATGNYEYFGNTDWDKELYSNNIQGMDHSLVVSGGTDNMNFILSGNLFQQGGIFKIKPDKYNRYNFRAKGGIKITNWLEINSNTSFARTGYNDPFDGRNVWDRFVTSGHAAPMGVIYNPDGSLTRTAANTIGVLFGDTYQKNDKNLIQQIISFNTNFFNNSLNINGDISFQKTNTEIGNKSLPISYSIKPNETLNLFSNSSLSKSVINNYYNTFNLYGDYSLKIKDHAFKILMGGNIETSNTEDFYLSRDDLLVSSLNAFNLAVGDNSIVSGGGNQWATLGVFSRIKYNYKEKYLFEINSRYDGSSKFPTSNQFAFFPSFSAAWRISEEGFLKNSFNWLDNLKFRASYNTSLSFQAAITP